MSDRLDPDASGNGYGALVTRVATFGERVIQRYPGAITCEAGCSGCCHVHLSVVGAEFERISNEVVMLPDEDQDAIRDRIEAGRDDPRCPLLDDEGLCRVYAVRPMICRTHGLPLTAGQPPERDVCPLNFEEGPPLDDLDDDTVLDVERINAILFVVDRLEGGDGSRVDLFDGLAEVLI